MNFALLNNKIVEARHSIKTKDNKYICPSCKDEVILRKGNIYIPHFAHKADSDCMGNDMTLTHRYAQQIFVESAGKILNLKGVSLEIRYNELQSRAYSCIKKEAEILKYKGQFPVEGSHVKCMSDMQVYMRDVLLEPNYKMFRPDIEIVSNSANRLFVEIYVRHKVDGLKLQKLQEYGVNTIEIDLRSIENRIKQGEVFDIKAEIEDILFSEKLYNNMKWLVRSDINNLSVNMSKYIDSYFNAYGMYRAQYGFIIYGPSNRNDLEIKCLDTINQVNRYFSIPLKYKYYRSFRLKNGYFITRVPLNKYLNEDYELDDNIVDSGYFVNNGDMVDTETGEVSEYSLMAVCNKMEEKRFKDYGKLIWQR